MDNFLATRVTTILRIRRKAGEAMHMTNRACCGLAVITDDCRYEYTTPTSLAVNDKTRVLFLPYGGDYDLLCTSPGLTRLINFEGYLPWNVPHDEPSSLAVELAGRFDSLADDASDYAKLSVLYGMFALLEKEKRTGAVPRILRPALAHLRANIDDPMLSNAALASLINVSEVYFRKLFTASVGVPPHTYLTNLRIERAKALLAGGEDSVETVAARCGFTSLYYFSSAFKKSVGMPPSAYRASHGGI